MRDVRRSRLRRQAFGGESKRLLVVRTTRSAVCSHKPTGSTALLPLGASFGSFERIDFRLLLALSSLFGVRGKIAGARLPFAGRVGIAAAISSCCQLRNTLAPFTLFHNLMAGASVVSTACFGHEGTFRSCLHSCTNHDKHLRICYSARAPSGEIAANNNRDFHSVKHF
jgi:hypothetical protein